MENCVNGEEREFVRTFQNSVSPGTRCGGLLRDVFGREKLLLGQSWLRFFPNPLSEIKALQIGLFLPKRAVSQPVDNCLYGMLFSLCLSRFYSLSVNLETNLTTINRGLCLFLFLLYIFGPLSFKINLIYQTLTCVGKYSRSIITIEYEFQMSPCNIQNSGHPIRVFQLLISCPCPGYRMWLHVYSGQSIL